MPALLGVYAAAAIAPTCSLERLWFRPHLAGKPLILLLGASYAYGQTNQPLPGGARGRAVACHRPRPSDAGASARAGGVAEILSQLYPQGLIDVDNQAALLKAIQKHIDKPQQVQPVNIFSLKEMCDQTLDVYKQILK